MAGRLTQLIVDSDNEESDEEEKEAVIFLGGFRIGLQIRKDISKVRERADKKITECRNIDKDKFIPDRLLAIN